MEDLWAFNTEKVARAVFACKKPVISAVGHETDFTICDFVADVRASTPSAGAELAVPDMWEIIKNLNNVKLDLSAKLKRRLEFEYQRLDEIQKGFVPAFEMSVNEKTDRLINAKNQLLSLYQFNLNERKAGFSNAVEKLNTLSPLATLARGYSVVKKDGGVIKKAESLKVNDEIDIIFSDGEVKCRVTE